MATIGSIVTGINFSTKDEYRAFETELLFGEKYQAKNNNSKGHSFLTCVLCGRDTSKQGNSNGVMVGAGGSLIVHPDDYEAKANDGGAMGWFPVGSECIKSVPAEFRVANPYENKVLGV